MGAGSGRRYAGGVLMLFCVLVITVSAVSVTLSPEQIRKGDGVTIDLQDLANGSDFSLLLEGTFYPPAEHFLFSITDFVMPISLIEGRIDAYAGNTNSAAVSVKKGTTTISMSGDSKNGIFESTEAQNVSQGAYDFLRIEGERTPQSDQVLTRFQLSGLKQGPDTSRISFVVEGVEKGTLTVRIWVDGQEIMNKPVTVVPPVTPETGAGTAPGENISPVTSSETQLPVSVSVNRSADGMVTIRTSEYVEIRPAEIKDVPKEWKLVLPSYAVMPENVHFVPPATLSFSLPAVEKSPLFLATWRDGAWQMLPSHVEGNSITAEITRSGIFGVMTFSETETATQAPFYNDSEQILPATTMETPSNILLELICLTGLIIAFRKFSS